MNVYGSTLASGGGGTSDYSDLSNKPSINGVTLSGNKTSSDLGISGSGINYSTSEQSTGLKWIDGSTIYQKTISTTAPNCTTSGTVVAKQTDTGLSTSYRIIEFTGVLWKTTNGNVMHDINSMQADSAISATPLYCWTNITAVDSTYKVNCKLTNANFANVPMYVTIKYIK